MATTDPNQGDVYQLLLDSYTQMGLASLAPLIFGYLQEGHGSDYIAIQLQDSPEYKQRFIGNQEIIRRIKAGEVGLHVLSPAEYVSQEKQYKEALTYYGLPSGFYDDPSDFASWIGKGVSVNEVQDRARLAVEQAQNAPVEVRDQLRNYYGIGDGDIAAYFLDDNKTLDLLKRRVAAADIGGAAGAQHLGVSRDRAEELGSYGVTQDQAKQGFAAIADILPTAEKLASLDNVQYDQQTAEDEVFKQDAAAAKKRRTLSQNEKARFAASSGAGAYSFAPDKGQV